jgi:ribose transport system substrate-binding protein
MKSRWFARASGRRAALWCLWLAALVVGAALALAACGSDDDNANPGSASGGGAGRVPDVPFEGSLEQGLPTSYDKPQPEELTIGLLVPLEAIETVKAVADATEAEVERLGGHVVRLDANGDPETQVSQAEQVIAQGVDGIAFPFILPAPTLPKVMARADAQGIPAVGVEVDVTTKDPVAGFASQIWTGRDETSYLQARAAAEALGEGAKVAQIGIALPVNTLQYGIERARFWAGKFGLKVVGQADAAPAGDIASGEQAMTQLLSKYPDAKGVIAFNDDTAVGAASAARAAGATDLRFFGYAGGTLGLDAVADGRLTATVQAPAVAAGQQLAWGIYDAIEGRKIPTVIDVPKPVLVNADTVESVPTYAEQLKELFGNP